MRQSLNAPVAHLSWVAKVQQLFSSVSEGREAMTLCDVDGFLVLVLVRSFLGEKGAIVHDEA